MKTEFIKHNSITYIIRARSDGLICAEIVMRIGKDMLPDDISLKNISLTYSYFRYWCQCQLALPFFVICNRVSDCVLYDNDLGIEFK